MGLLLDWVNKIAILVAHPIDPFPRGVGRGFLELVGFGKRGRGCGRLIFGLAGGFRIEHFLQPIPAHLARDDALGVGVVRVLLQELAVAVGARIALAQELFGAEFVPRRFRFLEVNFAAEGSCAGFPREAFAVAQFLRTETPGRLGYFQTVIGALDHKATAQLGKPLQVKASGEMVGRLFPGLQEDNGLLQGHIENAHFPRGRDLSRRAALAQRGRLGAKGDRSRILKTQPTACQIGRTITCQFEGQRFRDTLEPDAASDASAGPIIDLAAPHIFVNSPGHQRRKSMEPGRPSRKGARRNVTCPG